MAVDPPVGTFTVFHGYNNGMDSTDGVGLRVLKSDGTIEKASSDGNSYLPLSGGTMTGVI